MAEDKVRPRTPRAQVTAGNTVFQVRVTMTAMWRLAVAAALGCAGCAQLFGIKETSGGAHDASGAATLAVTRISVGGAS